MSVEPRTMKLYTIVNPSDPMTMYAPSIEVAALAVFLLGRGAIGAKDEEESTPVLFGWDEWLDERGMTDLEAAVDANRAEVVAALRSVMLGSKAARADLDDAMEAITDPERRRAFVAARNERRRSSLNDLETAAHLWADHIEKNPASRSPGAKSEP